MSLTLQIQLDVRQPQAMIDKMSITVAQAYGTTETTCGVFCNPWHYSEKPIGCVGVPLPNTEVKLLDDNGRDVAVGERGEVYCRGPQVALRYWHNEQASKDSFDEEGWYKTGDVGTVNEKGFFWIVDRKKVCFLEVFFFVITNDL